MTIQPGTALYAILLGGLIAGTIDIGSAALRTMDQSPESSTSSLTPSKVRVIASPQPPDPMASTASTCRFMTARAASAISPDPLMATGACSFS